MLTVDNIAVIESEDPQFLVGQDVLSHKGIFVARVLEQSLTAQPLCRLRLVLSDLGFGSASLCTA